MEKLPLRLGNIDFDKPFEGPNGNEEGLGDLGMEMKMIVKYFPGGSVTAQLFGAVPKEIKIPGRLYGAYARSRSFELQQVVESGDLVKLTYAEWEFEGIAKDYQAHLKGPNEVWFTFIFVPLLNNSKGGTSVVSAPTDPFSVTVSNALKTMIDQTLNAANGFDMPSDIQTGVNSLNNTISQQLQSNGGNVASLSSGVQQTIQNQIAGVQSLLQPLLYGLDPIAAAAAGDLSGSVGILNLAFGASAASVRPIETFRQMNPDLYRLAAFYYESPLKWSLIADATNLMGFDQPRIIDPLPVGDYKLIVPVDTSFSISKPPTVMQDDLAKAS